MGGEQEVLGRDPRGELLLDRKIALVLLRDLAVVAVTQVLEVTLPNLHALGQHDLLGRDHLEHVRV